MRQFDIISDIHLDFWVKQTESLWTLRKEIMRFIKLILPESCSQTLLIAGDLGHCNKQNYILLKLLQEYYANIIVVFGNHDYYLDPRMLSSRHHFDSMDRMEEMKQLIRQLPAVHVLEGNTIELDGVTYGGCSMWYDLQYGIQVLHADSTTIFDHWKRISNDAALLKGKPRMTLEMFKKEKAMLESILPQSEVIVTHFSPDWSHVPEGRQLDLTTSFYYFDGSAYMEHLAGKIWCYGHIHQRMDYVHQDCRWINASIGYPKENQHVPKKISAVRF